MARELRKQEVADAVKAYAEQHNLQVSNSEKGFVLMPGDVLVSCDEGKLTCNDPQVKEAIATIIMESHETPEPAKPLKTEDRPKKQANTTPPTRTSNLAPVVRSGGQLTTKDVLDYICPKATEKEAIIAVNICKARGMDPWSGDVHFIKYGDAPMTIVAGKEHFTKKAEANPQFDGFQAGIIVKGKVDIVESEGTFFLDGELVGGWAKVWRKDRKEPFVQKVKLSAFDTKKAQWSKMPEVMIRKVALVNALREAFPGELGGVYDASEMGQAMDVEYEET